MQLYIFFLGFVSGVAITVASFLIARAEPLLPQPEKESCYCSMCADEV